ILHRDGIFRPRLWYRSGRRATDGRSRDGRAADRRSRALPVRALFRWLEDRGHRRDSDARHGRGCAWKNAHMTAVASMSRLVIQAGMADLGQEWLALEGIELDLPARLARPAPGPDPSWPSQKIRSSCRCRRQPGVTIDCTGEKMTIHSGRCTSHSGARHESLTIL